MKSSAKSRKIKGVLIVIACIVVVFSLFFMFGTNILKSSYALDSTSISNTDNKNFTLNSFKFKNKNVKNNDKLYFDVDYNYNGQLSFISLGLENINTLQGYYFSTTNLQYFDLNNAMNYLATGEYRIIMLSFFPTSGSGFDEAIYYKNSQLSSEPEDNIQLFDFSNQNIFITDDNAVQDTKTDNADEIDSSTSSTNSKNNVADYVMSINTKSASIGEKVSLNIGLSPSQDNKNEKIDIAMLSFTNSSDKTTLNVYVKDLNSNPYFIVPSSTTVGSYYLDYMYLILESGEKIYYKMSEQDSSGVFAYDSSFNVIQKEIDKTKYVLNNEQYNDNVIDDLSKLNNDALITINANNNSVIDEKIFNLIKDTKRTLFIDYGKSQWIFSGSDIVSPKTIDVSTFVENLSTSDYYNDFLKKNISNTSSAMLRFSDNGSLPGKTLIRLDSDEISKFIDGNKLSVYYYKEDSDKLIKVALEIQKNNNFYEFYLNHNSKYILTSNKINSSIVSDDRNLLSLNTSNDNKELDNNIVIYVLSGLAVVVVLVIIVIFISKRKRKKNR